MKKAARIALAVFGAPALLLLLSFVNHRVQLGREEGLYVPLGTMVEVDGGQMSVYTGGGGTQTLVFLEAAPAPPFWTSRPFIPSSAMAIGWRCLSALATASAI